MGNRNRGFVKRAIHTQRKQSRGDIFPPHCAHEQLSNSDPAPARLQIWEKSDNLFAVQRQGAAGIILLQCVSGVAGAHKHPPRIHVHDKEHTYTYMYMYIRGCRGEWYYERVGWRAGGSDLKPESRAAAWRIDSHKRSFPACCTVLSSLFAGMVLSLLWSVDSALT
jgi:hypothetical protein